MELSIYRFYTDFFRKPGRNKVMLLQIMCFVSFLVRLGKLLLDTVVLMLMNYRNIRRVSTLF